jgi:fructose-1,6-bisphosphatase I
MYECNPMAMIVEQAGGKATDGFQDILEIEPTDIHQRCSLFIGSTAMVDESMQYLKQYSDENLQPTYVSSKES